MPNELTNLLPIERQKIARRNYFTRLGVVAMTFALFLVIANGALLVPTYVFLIGSMHTKQARLADVEKALSTTDDSQLSARLAALTNDATSLIALQDAPSPSSLIREILTVPRPGITLSGLNYTPASGKDPIQLAVSGSAATRDALRSYQLALQTDHIVARADLPVSAYAKDSNIPFTITLTLAP